MHTHATTEKARYWPPFQLLKRASECFRVGSGAQNACFRGREHGIAMENPTWEWHQLMLLSALDLFRDLDCYYQLQHW